VNKRALKHLPMSRMAFNPLGMPFIDYSFPADFISRCLMKTIILIMLQNQNPVPELLPKGCRKAVTSQRPQCSARVRLHAHNAAAAAMLLLVPLTQNMLRRCDLKKIPDVRCVLFAHSRGQTTMLKCEVPFSSHSPVRAHF
jgi:hypothetical protein